MPFSPPQGWILFPVLAPNGAVATPSFAFASEATLGIFRSAAGVIGLGSTFSRVALGDVTSSFPAIKRNAAAINFRLGDDSADAAITASTAGLSGKIPTYNNVATAGWGVPAVYASGRATAQAAANASVATYTVGAADGSFDVCANVLVTTATTHTFTIECAYTDEGNTARTLTMSFTLVAGGTVTTSIVNTNGTVPYLGIAQRIRCKASTSITLRTQAAGTYTTVAYNVEGTIAQVA